MDADRFAALDGATSLEFLSALGTVAHRHGLCRDAALASFRPLAGAATDEGSLLSRLLASDDEMLAIIFAAFGAELTGDNLWRFHLTRHGAALGDEIAAWTRAVIELSRLGINRLTLAGAFRRPHSHALVASLLVSWAEELAAVRSDLGRLGQTLAAFRSHGGRHSREYKLAEEAAQDLGWTRVESAPWIELWPASRWPEFAGLLSRLVLLTRGLLQDLPGLAAEAAQPQLGSWLDEAEAGARALAAMPLGGSELRPAERESKRFATCRGLHTWTLLLTRLRGEVVESLGRFCRRAGAAPPAHTLTRSEWRQLSLVLLAQGAVVAEVETAIASLDDYCRQKGATGSELLEAEVQSAHPLLAIHRSAVVAALQDPQTALASDQVAKNDILRRSHSLLEGLPS